MANPLGKLYLMTAQNAINTIDATNWLSVQPSGGYCRHFGFGVLTMRTSIEATPQQPRATSRLKDRFDPDAHQWHFAGIVTLAAGLAVPTLAFIVALTKAAFIP